MTDYKLLDLSQKLEWKEKFSKLPIPQQDIYFLPEYIEIYEDYGDGKSKCFIFEKDENLILYPFLLRDIPQNPDLKDIVTAYGYGGPISSDPENKEFINSFRLAFSDYCKSNNIITEFIRFHPLLNNCKMLNDYVNTKFNRYTVYVDLSKPIEDIFKEFHSQNRSDVRKALKSNIEILSNNNQAYINNFIELYYSTMEKNHASNYYYFTKEYFSELFTNLNKNIILLNIIFEDTVIASAIFMGNGEFFHYHLAASNYEYQKVRPNNFLLYKAIEYAQNNGYKWFHLGGGASSDEDDKLLNFKKRFSQNISSFYVGYQVHNEEIYHDLCNQWKTNNPDKIEEVTTKFFFPIYRA